MIRGCLLIVRRKVLAELCDTVPKKGCLGRHASPGGWANTTKYPGLSERTVLRSLSSSLLCRLTPQTTTTTMRSYSLVILAVALGASATPLSTNPYALRENPPFAVAPLLVEEHPHGTVNGSYVVMLKRNVAPALMTNHMNFVQTVHEQSVSAGDDAAGLRHVYDSHVKGYAGTFSDSVIDAIRQMPEVDYIERDQIVRTMEFDVAGSGQSTQLGAPWVRNLSPRDSRLRLTSSYERVLLV